MHRLEAPRLTAVLSTAVKRFMGVAGIAVSLLSFELRAQLPITLTGSLRLHNLTNVDSIGFVPDPGGPATFLEAYGFVGIDTPASYPPRPPGFNDVPGGTLRVSYQGGKKTFVFGETIFYVTAATSFMPSAGNPLVLERQISGEWAFFDGDHLAPLGVLRGTFQITIATLPGPIMTSGTALGTLSPSSGSGTLAGAGPFGAIHDLGFEPANFPNWLNNFIGPPGGPGGDVLYLAVSPVARRAAVSAYSIPPGGEDAECVDLDGDLRPELLTTPHSGSGLTILTNDGTGLYSPGGSIPVSPDPIRVRAGLVNADALPDLVLAHDFPPRLEIRLGLGGGSFGPPTTLPLPLAPGDLVVSDVSGDGRVELFCAMPGTVWAPGLVQVLINDGNGGFPLVFDVTAGIGRPHEILVDNNPGPGQPDLFVTDGGTLFNPQACVLLYDLGPGGATLLGAVPTPPDPRGLAVVDLDIDDIRDLVVASLGNPIAGPAGEVTVFRGTGPASFAPGLQVMNAVSALDVSVSDHDRNGRADLFIAALDRSETTLLSAWNGAGFDQVEVISMGGPTTRVINAELNGDGFPDLVALNSSAAGVGIVLTIPRAQGEKYGIGCAGSFGLVPRISQGRYANLGNRTYTIQVRDALPGTTALLFLSFRGASALVPGGAPAGCSVLIAGSPPHLIPGTGAGQFVQTTDASGFAEVLLGIPPSPGFDFLEGLILYAQWAVLDPLGTVATIPALSLSDGLRLTLY